MILKVLKFNIFLSLLFSYEISFSKTSSYRDTIPRGKNGRLRDSRILSLGVGFGNFDLDRMIALRSTQNYSISSLSVSRPLYTKLEFFSTKHFGGAIAANYNSVQYYYDFPVIVYNRKSSDRAFVSYQIVTINIRINYYIFIGKNIDVYVGGGSGLRISMASTSHSGVRDLLRNGFFREFEATAGIRYLYKKVGIYAETGLSRSLFQAGLCFKIGR